MYMYIYVIYIFLATNGMSATIWIYFCIILLVISYLCSWATTTWSTSEIYRKLTFDLYSTKLRRFLNLRFHHQF